KCTSRGKLTDIYFIDVGVVHPLNWFKSGLHAAYIFLSFGFIFLFHEFARTQQKTESESKQ
ncbi:MAG: hypothetical protein WAW27_01950, partial [Chitinophagaceae bacterium]